MFIATKKLFLLLTVIFACDHCVSTPVRLDGPKFRLANGTVLKDEAKIIITYGNPVELVCTGQVNDLQVTKNHNEIIPTTILNQTTIKIFEEKLERNYYNYYCTDSKRQVETSVKVLVDSPPVVTKFQCKSENLESMICTWTTANLKCDTALYYVKNEVFFHLCNLEYERSAIHRRPYCTWNQKHPVIKYELVEKTLNFLMTNCNAWGCENQTFVINHLEVIKLGEPTELQLIQKTSYSALLRWHKPFLAGLSAKFIDTNGLSTKLALDYKVICLYSGIYQFQVNKTEVTDIFGEDKVEIELNMPCEDTFYEVRVSVKLPTAGEEFWSEDGVTSFVTDPEPEDVDTVVDSTCKHQRVKITPDVMLFEIDRFKSKIREKLKTLKESITSLKLKTYLTLDHS